MDSWEEAQEVAREMMFDYYEPNLPEAIDTLKREGAKPSEMQIKIVYLQEQAEMTKGTNTPDDVFVEISWDVKAEFVYFRS